MSRPSDRRAIGTALLTTVIVLCAGGVVGLSVARARRAVREADELAAATALKAIVFPAEVRFQKDAVRDDDGDQVGEFGALTELAHGDLVLPPGLAAGIGDGYRFAIWLPTGEAAAADAAVAAGAAGAELRERRFLAYAWPEAGGAGRTLFALDQDGRMYAAPAGADGAAPAWDAAIAEPRWGAHARWPEWAP